MVKYIFVSFFFRSLGGCFRLHLWYSTFHTGAFISFNIESLTNHDASTKTTPCSHYWLPQKDFLNTNNIPILPISIMDFCKQKLWPLLCSEQTIWYMLAILLNWGMMQSRESCLWHKSYGEQEQEQENQTVETKKAPLQEGPN